MSKTMSRSLQENSREMDTRLAIDKSFDLLKRNVQVGGKDACLYFMESFIKVELVEKLLEFFYGIDPTELSADAQDFAHDFLPHVEVDCYADYDTVIEFMLSGLLCLFVDGYQECLVIDCRTYPTRSVTEPDKDKVMRGSKDGFVETLVFNTALVRRRIRSTALRMELVRVGTDSRTDVVICYMEDRVDHKYLDYVKTRLSQIQVDALTMNQESLAECLYERKWYNPFPKFKYTERPDVTAATVLEGRLAILVDTSPEAMLLPTSVFEIAEEPDDFYFPPVTGTYLKLSRFLIMVATLYLTPVWLLLIQNPQWIPKSLEFIRIADAVNVPILVQLLILEIAVDGLKMASVNTPNMLNTPLSIMAGLVLGEFSVKSGWFNAETMLYMAFVVVANYTQASLELGYALKFMRIMLLCLTAFFHLPGFVIGVILTLLFISFNRVVGNKSYLYPLIPFSGKALLHTMFRVRIRHRQKEPKSNE